MRRKPKQLGLAWAVFLFYIAVLARLILMKNGLPPDMIEAMTLERLQFRVQHAANFTPFKTIGYYLSGHANLPIVIQNIGGNIILFSPLGFLMPFLRPSFVRARRIAAISFVASLILEVVQVLTGLGSFDVDDLLLNVLGGMIGFLAWKAVHRLVASSSDRRLDLDSGA